MEQESLAAQAKVQAETALQLSIDGLTMAGGRAGAPRYALEALRAALIAAADAGADPAMVALHPEPLALTATPTPTPYPYPKP